MRPAQRFHRQGCTRLPMIDEDLSAAPWVLREPRFVEGMETCLDFSGVPACRVIDDNGHVKS